MNQNMRIRQINSNQQYYNLDEKKYQAGYNIQNNQYQANPISSSIGSYQQESRQMPQKNYNMDYNQLKQPISQYQNQYDYVKTSSVHSDINQQYGANKVVTDQQRMAGLSSQNGYNSIAYYQPSTINSSNSQYIYNNSYSNQSINYAKNNYLSNNSYQSYSSSTASSNKNSLSASNSSSSGQNDIRNIQSKNYLYEVPSSNNPIGSYSNLSVQQGQSKSNISQQIPTNTSSQVSLKKVNNRKCGLANIGNTCYMNSALQCVFNIPGFLEQFLSNKYKSQLNPSNKGVADEFSDLVKNVENSQGKYSSQRPSGLKRAIERVNQQFYGSGQQDAQELLRTLLDGLHNDLNRVQGKKPYRELEANIRQKSLEKIGEEWFQYYLDRDNSLVTDFFTGQLMSQVTCQLCQSESIAFDNFMDLSLSFTQSFRIINQHDLDRLLQAFLKEEALDDTYYCKNCKKHTKSKRQFYIWRLPDILVIHLKRFHFGTQRREKLNLSIAFPINDLDMGKYMERQKNQEQLYDLIGVVNHSGSLYGGHYTAQCKNPYDGTWNEFNDSSWNEININSQNYVKGGSSEPYLLFYCRKGHQNKYNQFAK